MQFMFSKTELAKILFLDIETVRGKKHFEELPEGMKAMWEHKAKSIKTEEEQAIEEKYNDRAAIYAEFGKVVCISIGFVHWIEDVPHIKLKSFFGADEAQVLTDFGNLLNSKFKDWKLCAHNGKEFDFPYLCRRFLIHQIAIPKLLAVQGLKPWEVPFVDTMELWKFGDYKSYTKLELLCQVFDIPTPKDDMDGSMVGKVFWEENDAGRIAKYCEKDVIATIQVMMKFAFFDLVAETSIQSDL